MSDAVEAMDEAAWGRLRQRVRARMQEERLTYKRLGAQLHPPLTESTTTNSINRKSPPGPKVVESLRTWLASEIMPSVPLTADPLAVLAKALKRKLHRAALTRTTVAQLAGVEVEDLDAALLGEPIASDAMAKLAAWAG
jgi:hypothetical protein